ncbi:MAG: porin family protein [Bacteroidia bacterium]
MKKIFTIASIVFSASLLLAQSGENELKNFRFGLKVVPSVNWYKPEGKIISANGVTPRFGGGLVMEFRLSKVASIQTGAQIDIDGGKLRFNNGGTNNAGANTVSYYYNTLDDKIVHFDPVLASSPSYVHYQLNERVYRITYVTVPLTLKMKTKEIGAFTYYGQIGVNNSFRWKAFADDELQIIDDVTNTLGSKDSKSKVDITQDMSVYAAALNFGLGAEMNLAGTTSLVFGVNYNLGFTNVVMNDSKYINRRANEANFNATSNPSAFILSKMPQEVKSSAVALTVGILF